MTRDEARVILENKGSLSYHVWYFTSTWMTCGGSDGYSCCEDNFSSIEEALESIEWYCGGNWEEVDNND